MLTEIAVKKAKAGSKAYKMADGRGLYLFVTTTGFKSWRYNYRFGGKSKTLVLGEYPETGLKKARDLRDDARRSLRDGRDPSILKKLGVQAGGDRSFEAVAKSWHDTSQGRWRKRHTDDVLRSLERDVFPFIGPMDVDAIDEPLLLSVLRKIEARGAIETAHRVRQRCDRVFKTAKALGMTRQNPAADLGQLLKPFSKGRRWPAVTDLKGAREVSAIIDAAAVSPLTKLASRFLALTAQRPGTIASAQWSEFSGVILDGKADESGSPTWVIPSDKMKVAAAQGAENAGHVVPLCRQAVEVLTEAYRFSGKGKFVFPSARSGLEPMSSNALNMLYKREGLQGRHVPHGWRAAFSTIMNDRFERALPGTERLLIERLIIDLMLAHVPAGMSATELVYNRAAYLPRRREIAQDWADLLLEGARSAAELAEGPRRRPS